ncbi:hypothetical protein BU17DRAFT_86080 [Hysterangium stoloniferum]|nr:hypothetical protein BU17DRAFT_86080 [Hysterangium stoloniferum]
MDGKSEHEYFIAMILHADGTTGYIRIERFGEDYITPNTSQRYSALFDSLKEGLAKDQVSMVGGWPNGNKLLEKVNIENTKVTLLDFAIAARIVNIDQYMILKQQCYWYSDMFGDVAEIVYGWRSIQSIWAVRVKSRVTRRVEERAKEQRSNPPVIIYVAHRQSGMDIAAIVVNVAGDAVPVPGLKSAATLVLEIIKVIGTRKTWNA